MCRFWGSALLFLAVCLVACSESSVSDDSANREDIGVVASADDLPPCTAENDGEPFFVKSEKLIRVCSDTKWYAIKNEGSDEKGGNGEKKDSLDSDKGCYVSEKTADSLWVTCGSYSFSVPTSGANDGGSVVLDSEKIATSLEGVSGFTQKGPFLMGSEVNVIELRDGRTLEQTGDNFEAKIQSDDGQFKLNARMMMSQYLELHAKGYYRNEVNGKNSNAQLTLYALTDVMMRSGGVVNINLLTHLEYHRVVYLVKNKKMRVAAAKDTAEREIFNLLHIDSKDFFSSEDLNIVGSSEGDAALLAFSVMFQGDRDVSQLSALLTSVSTDMEKDGVWNDTKMRDSIADWAENADATGHLAKIRANVEGWGLSAMVPNFEKYIRSFWTKEYGLPTCDKSTVDTLVAAGAKRLAESKNRYICVDSAKVGYMWRRATDLEKDTHSWKSGSDGQIKNGDINTTVKYVYDSVLVQWREMTEAEGYYGFCNEALEADTSKNVNYNKVNKTGDGPYVVCENRQWVPHDTYYAETHFWENPAEEGTIRRGKFTTNVYVYEQNLGFWRVGWLLESDLEMACVSINEGKKIHKQPLYEGDDDAYYTCRYHTDGVKPQYANGINYYDEHYVETEYRWEKMDYTLANNTFDIVCEEEGKMIKGTVDDLYFVCDGGNWRYANSAEIVFCLNKDYYYSCTEATAGTLSVIVDSVFYCPSGYPYFQVTSIGPSDYPGQCGMENMGVIYYDLEKFPRFRNGWNDIVGTVGSDWICKQNGWHRTDIYDYTPETMRTHLDNHEPIENGYGTLRDSRDGAEYKTILMGDGHEWMAENLRYSDSNETVNLKGNSWCWNDEPSNCEIGGRLYSWYAAVDFNERWGAGAQSLIQDQHQGICPHGWHLPSVEEWDGIMGDDRTDCFKHTHLMAVGFGKDIYDYWNAASNNSGFSAIPVGYRNSEHEGYYYPGRVTGFWTTRTSSNVSAVATVLPCYSSNSTYEMAGSSWDINPALKSGLSVRCVKDYIPSGN